MAQWINLSQNKRSREKPVKMHCNTIANNIVTILNEVAKSLNTQFNLNEKILET